MSNEHKKIISWRETKSVKKDRVNKWKVRRRLNTISDEDMKLVAEAKALREREWWNMFNIDVKNLIKWKVPNFHWPTCRICEHEFAPYDHAVCTNCTEAMERLKKK